MSFVRLLDLGLVPSLRSQTIYHALAYAMAPGSPDTIVLVSPATPYVCIGFHQELEKEVDLEYCRAAGLPVYRREVGGGAVYLDRDQLFAQWIFHADRLPPSIEERFEYYIRPLVESYHALGIPAYHRPLNDIHVAGRKIGGTGAARIGLAEVVVGSFMFDFDSDVMSRVLKVPSEKMRDKLCESLQQYMTTMARELGQPPDRGLVKRVYAEKCAATLGRDVVPGRLSEREEAVARRLDRQFKTDGWLRQRGGLRRSGVKIHAGVRVVEAARKAPGGLIRVTARLRDGRIDDLSISGDFTMQPATGVDGLEEAVKRTSTTPDALRARVREAYEVMGLRSPGVTPEDFAEAILAAVHCGDETETAIETEEVCRR